MKEAIIKTGGMTCTSCERAISNALMKVDGVMEAKADYASETTKVKYDENRVNLDGIGKAVDAIGYDYGGEAGEKKGFRLPFFSR
ncbi:MAG: heavy-metal-associated domain-containing protein [Candidatus ainarchaeum sp.]|nr:heavy-metal-associated domain-containing protein [Candidatus ainarchaeum sp.]